MEVLDGNGIEYDNVRLVDIDTMVHWDCPNFFEPNGEFGGAIQDRFFIEVTIIVLMDIKILNMFKFDWTSYFNCGFIVLNKNTKIGVNQ